MINNKLEEFKRYIKNRKVAFIGIGVSNIPAIKYLNRLGANITAFDKKGPNELGDICIELESLGIRLVLGENYLESLIGYDVIFRSPTAMPYTMQIAREVNSGAILTSEIEMVMELCPGKIIGITGSGGKTTTTTLIGEMLKEQGLNYYIGGNIGIPLLDKIEEMNQDTILVLELSSFQLMTMTKSPNISIMTSLSPDHLDVHRTLDEYYDAKKNIFKFQDKDDVLILNYDDEILRKFKNEAKGLVKFFSAKEKLNDGVIIDDGRIKKAENKIRKHIINTDDILMLGKCNLMNLCAAILAVENLVSIENIQKIAKTFPGVEHRMEIIGEKNGIIYVNNSIASSPIKAISCLESFDEKVIVIAGGYDKKVEFNEFAKCLLQRAKAVVLCGDTKQKIKDAINEEIDKINVPINLKISECNKFDDVVRLANEFAKNGDTVILCPACASFDFFKNYKERGYRFRELIEKC